MGKRRGWMIAIAATLVGGVGCLPRPQRYPQPDPNAPPPAAEPAVASAPPPYPGTAPPPYPGTQGPPPYPGTSPTTPTIPTTPTTDVPPTSGPQPYGPPAPGAGGGPQPQPYPPQPQPDPQQPYPQQPYPPQPQPPYPPDPPIGSYSPVPNLTPQATTDPLEEDERETWTPSEPVRLTSMIGVLGTTGYDRDLETSIGFGTRTSLRISEYLTLGLTNALFLRNWSELGRYYGYISDCEKLDTRCDHAANYWAIGWAMAIASAQAGFDIMLRPEGTQHPWLSIGSTLVVFQSGRGFGEDGTADFHVGHAGALGVGYDFDVVGFGLRATYANDWTAFASSGPPLLSVMFSIDVLLPRDHPDRRVKRKNFVGSLHQLDQDALATTR